MLVFFKEGDHCKYYIKLCYKAPWEVCVLFSGFSKVLVRYNTEDNVPKGEGSVTSLVKIPCNKS